MNATTISSRRLRAYNFGASALLIGAVAIFYASVPYYQRYFAPSTNFMGVLFDHKLVLQAAALAYLGVLLLFYFGERLPRVSKSVWCLYAVRRCLATPRMVWREGLPGDEKLGLLSVLLKAFFVPLMVVWLFDHTALMLAHGRALMELGNLPASNWMSVFNAHGFWFLFKLILFLDVFFYTIGYLIELPALNNEIRSVDPTLLGWGVALACYPPFNGLTSTIFGWQSTDFPQFADMPMLHVVANLLLLGLMGVYSWASIALNFKASNLTHRGVIAHGPYRYIRHPAYVCKNLAWWIGIGPALIVASNESLTSSLIVVGSMVGWSVMYYMRALTEEDHLRGVDSEYDAYCQKVKYRFVPGII